MKTSPLFRFAGKFLSVVLFVALLLAAGAAPRAAAAPLATYSEPFDTDGNWVNVTGASLIAYGTKTYSDATHPEVAFRGEVSLRQGSTAQDGVAGTHSGAYAWRLRDADGSFWQAKIASGGVGTFSVWVRRWDSTPDTNYVAEYSIDNGANWTSVQTINNAWLGSSSWKQVTGTVNMSNTSGDSDDIVIRIRRLDGTFERLMVDDFEMTDYSGVDNPPKVTSASPTGSGVAVNSNITINFNETVDVTSTGVTLECPAGTPVTFSGLPANDVSSVTLDPTSDLPNGVTCTVTAVASGITDNDGTADQLDGNGDGNGGDNYSFTFTTVSAGFTKIHDIQGSGSTANSGTFNVEAIVVGDYQGATGVDDFKLDGFFIQEEDADADANAATSEGILVFCQTCPTNVNVGDKVQVTGASSEYYGMSELTATTAGAVSVISTGNALPTPASLTLPVPGVTATDLAGATAQIDAYYEPFEGMLVKFPATLSVTEYFELFRYGQVVLAQGGRFRQLTDTSSPSTSGYTAHEIDLARRTVILDDDSNQENHALAENPDIPVFHPATAGFSTSNYFRGGDTIANLTGVLHWSFAGFTGTDAWRIRPVTEAFSYAFTVANGRPAAPTVTGNVKVASFNVLNYFTTLNSRGANSAAEFTRQSDKTVAAITGLNADVVGLMELENNGTAIADLVSKINAVAGAGTYSYVNTGVVGSDQITVGIIYKSAKVTPVGAVQTLTAAAFTDPNSTGSQRSRPAVAQLFEENTWGERFTVVVNHLKSKSCSSTTGADLDQLDGQGCWSDTRQKGAAYLVNTWVPALASSLGDADFLIIGDLNSYRKDTAITNITGASYTDLINSYLGAAGYGYVFDGQLGYLDHALSNSTLTPQVTGLAEWHINADEVNLLDYNDTIKDTGEQDFDAKPTATNLYEANAYRSSDHDPVLIGLSIYPDHSTNTSYGDAWHTGSGAPRLGATWSRDASAGVDGSDDGMVDFVGLDPNWGSGGGYITVDVRGVGASGACIYGWIDWNKNNSFDDSGEASTPASTAADDAALQVSWAAPTVFDGAPPNPRSYNLRLRVVPGACGSHLLAGAAVAALSPSANLPPTGGASGGEAEDHTLNFTPTAVRLSGLAATQSAAPVIAMLGLALLLALAVGVIAARRPMRPAATHPQR